jgi:hypothetical protein
MGRWWCRDKRLGRQRSVSRQPGGYGTSRLVRNAGELREGGLADCLATHSTDNRLANDVRLTPRRKVIYTLCRLFLISGVVGGDNLLETIPGNVLSVCDIEFGDQVVLPLSISHFSSSLLGFVPEELGSQTGSTGSCRLWDLVPRVGHGFWLFTLWQEFQFGD